jgi:hypothetical protein
MATVTQEYAASSNLTVTNLHSLAASTSLLSGWTSGTIDNTSTKYTDIVVSAQFTKASSNMQAGVIQVWGYAMLDDSTWPDVFSSGTEGTQGTATIHDDEQKAEAFVLLWSTVTDTGTSEVHNMRPVSLRAAFGFVPAKCAIFITGSAATSTNAQLAASGNQVTTKGLYEIIA